MHRLLRCGMIGPCCLLACSSTLSSPEVTPTGASTYRLDRIELSGDLQALGAVDINDQGQLAGDALGISGQAAFTWSAGSGFAVLARLEAADYVSAVAINESGVVAGNAWLSDGTSRPVIWTDPGRAQDLGVSGTAMGMNDLGHVVGNLSPEDVAFLWDATSGTRMLGTLGGTWSVANRVNAADEVVGTSELADGTSHAFRWSKGTMTDLGALNGRYSEGYAISDSGVVTGTYQGPSDEIRVFRWTASEGMVDVGPTYADATDGPTSLSTDINAVGQIVGGVQPPGLMLRAAVRQPASGAWQELTADWPFESFALGVNNRGVIVGRTAESENPDVPGRAAIWTPVPSVVGVGAR